MRRWWRGLFCAGMALCLCGCTAGQAADSRPVQGCILIDPGHGGMDGGTQAEDGTLEKHLNLDISLSLRDMLAVCGFPVEMTRCSDVSIHDPTAGSVREKKVSDMRNRLALYETAGLVISVHQNHFSQEKYAGATVYYSGNHPDSQALAVCVREELLRLLQPENHRELKKATDGIYLLYHTNRPAILVECGFLSNHAERERLKTTEYRQQMAFTVLGGYFAFLSQK